VKGFREILYVFREGLIEFPSDVSKNVTFFVLLFNLGPATTDKLVYHLGDFQLPAQIKALPWIDEHKI
jgi:hypothetical protein